jgi:hypothetical protein
MNIAASNVLRHLFLITTMAISMSSFVLAISAGAAISAQLLAICADVQEFIGILAVVLFALGAILYAVSHLLPAAGNIKGNLQGWSLNMIVGAVVAIVIYFLAPFVAQQIVNYGDSGGGVTVGSITC